MNAQILTGFVLVYLGMILGGLLFLNAVAPGLPSPLRPRKPPSWATMRIASPRAGGVPGRVGERRTERRQRAVEHRRLERLMHRDQARLRRLAPGRGERHQPASLQLHQRLRQLTSRARPSAPNHSSHPRACRDSALLVRPGSAAAA